MFLLSLNIWSFSYSLGFFAINRYHWTNSQLPDSSVGRALHWYRRGHGFKSRSSLNFFQALISQPLKLCNVTAVIIDVFSNCSCCNNYYSGRRVTCCETKTHSGDGGSFQLDQKSCCESWRRQINGRHVSLAEKSPCIHVLPLVKTPWPSCMCAGVWIKQSGFIPWLRSLRANNLYSQIVSFHQGI